MKSASLMFNVEAVKPPTLTCEPLPNSTPLGLRMNTCPFALRLPRIWLGSCPSTRFSAIAEAFGWIKFTASLAPMPKLCQLMARFWLLWVMVVLAPAWAMLPRPALICPPVGAASANGASNAPLVSAKVAAMSLSPEMDLPRPLVFSETATQVLNTWLHTKR